MSNVTVRDDLMPGAKNDIADVLELASIIQSEYRPAWGLSTLAGFVLKDANFFDRLVNGRVTPAKLMIKQKE